MNWKMTAKTTLIQLHHKIQTFEGWRRHLVLVVQDEMLKYLKTNFRFSHFVRARSRDSCMFMRTRWQLGLAEA